jgi:hypothetical protein
VVLPLLILASLAWVPAPSASSGPIRIRASQSLPIKIDQPGSYALGGNVNVTNANTTAILITVSDVTLDLAGFAILGPTVCTGTSQCAPVGNGRGIDASTVDNITILHGTVRGMGDDGIIVGPNSLVQGVTARSNGLDGINVGVRSEVMDSHSFGNGHIGIDAGNDVRIKDCHTSYDVYGIHAGTGSIVTGSHAVANVVDGIDIQDGGSIVDRNVAEAQSIAEGIAGGTGSIISWNVTTGNSTGIGDFGGSSLVVNNVSTSNSSRGMWLTDGDGYGFNVLSGNTEANLYFEPDSVSVQLSPSVCGLNMTCP